MPPISIASCPQTPIIICWHADGFGEQPATSTNYGAFPCSCCQCSNLIVPRDIELEHITIISRNYGIRLVINGVGVDVVPQG